MNESQKTLLKIAEDYRKLEEENTRLKSLLIQNGIPLPDFNLEESHSDPDQGSLIQFPYINKDMLNIFFNKISGRTDVYALKSNKGNYFPQCINRWNIHICPKHSNFKFSCQNCLYKNWRPFTPKVLLDHLLGRTNPIGIYPLREDQTCRFLVFDFDGHDEAISDQQIRSEAESIRTVCTQLGIDCLVERSYSGRGAHVWILFSQPVEASKARTFGNLLIRKGIEISSFKSFRCYDRMFPSQDESDFLGNLIALPMHGAALGKGNTAFVDEFWNAYPNQWRKLYNCRSLTLDKIDSLISQWSQELSSGQNQIDRLEQYRPNPWKRNEKFSKSDVLGEMRIILSDAVYIDSLNLQPRIQNQLRNMAAISNPEFYSNQRMKYSNWNTSRIIYLGSDENSYIRLPRGILEKLLMNVEQAGIQYQLHDKRNLGIPLNISFNGELRPEQKKAKSELLGHDSGIVEAATAFGKTVLCANLIAEYKVNTLIVIDNSALLEQWVSELEKFLEFQDPMPEYRTPSGKLRKRKSHIGILQGAKNTLNGRIDIAMAQSLVKHPELIHDYGMVIVDECHHAASSTYRKILDRVHSRFLYGVTATPKRTDQLEPIEFMMIGNILTSYTLEDKVRHQRFERILIPRTTRSRIIQEERPTNYQALEYIAQDGLRNDLIEDDVRKAISQKRTCAVFTSFKSHARELYERLKDAADHVYLLYGDKSQKENSEQIREMLSVSDNETVLLIAIRTKIGEGFSFPRLDTLFLTMPMAGETPMIQVVGRLDRNYPGKMDVRIYDYIDRRIPILNSKFRKRIGVYKKAGYEIASNPDCSEISKVIYSMDNYFSVFEHDLRYAKREVIISSSFIEPQKADWFINLMKDRGDLRISVISTQEAADSEEQQHTLHELRKSRIDLILIDDEIDNFAVIDHELIWDGGINLLGPADSWNHLIRFRSNEAAEELLELNLADN